MNSQKSQSQKAAQKRLDVAIMNMNDEILELRVESLKKWAAQADSLADDLEAGANPAALTIPLCEDNDEVTSALVIAAARGWTKVVCLFLRDKELDVNAVDSEGDHALLAALKRGRGETAQLLLARSNVELVDKEGASCLARAVESQLADEAAAIVERMSHAERVQEFEALRKQSLAREGSGRESKVAGRIQALLLSKIEAEVLEASAERAFAEGQGSLGRPRSL